MLVRDEMVRNGEEPSVDSARVSDTKAFNKKGCIAKDAENGQQRFNTSAIVRGIDLWMAMSATAALPPPPRRPPNPPPRSPPQPKPSAPPAYDKEPPQKELAGNIRIKNSSDLTRSSKTNVASSQVSSCVQSNSKDNSASKRFQRSRSMQRDSKGNSKWPSRTKESSFTSPKSSSMRRSRSLGVASSPSSATGRKILRAPTGEDDINMFGGTRGDAMEDSMLYRYDQDSGYGFAAHRSFCETNERAVAIVSNRAQHTGSNRHFKKKRAQQSPPLPLSQPQQQQPQQQQQQQTIPPPIVTDQESISSSWESPSRPTKDINERTSPSLKQPAAVPMATYPAPPSKEIDDGMDTLWDPGQADAMFDDLDNEAGASIGLARPSMGRTNSRRGPSAAERRRQQFPSRIQWQRGSATDGSDASISNQSADGQVEVKRNAALQSQLSSNSDSSLVDNIRSIAHERNSNAHVGSIDSEEANKEGVLLQMDYSGMRDDGQTALTDEELLSRINRQARMALKAQVESAQAIRDDMMSVVHVFRDMLRSLPLPQPASVDIEQAIKDAGREAIRVSGGMSSELGILFEGDSVGVQAEVRKLLSPIVYDKAVEDSLVNDIMRASSRTSWGGDAYSIVNQLLGRENAPVPIPADLQTLPIHIQVSSSRSRGTSSSNNGEVMTLGVSDNNLDGGGGFSAELKPGTICITSHSAFLLYSDMESLMSAKEADAMAEPVAVGDSPACGSSNYLSSMDQPHTEDVPRNTDSFRKPKKGILRGIGRTLRRSYGRDQMVHSSKSRPLTIQVETKVCLGILDRTCERHLSMIFPDIESAAPQCSVLGAGEEDVNGTYYMMGFRFGSPYYTNRKGVYLTRESTKGLHSWVFGRSDTIFYEAAIKPEIQNMQTDERSDMFTSWSAGEHREGNGGRRSADVPEPPQSHSPPKAPPPRKPAPPPEPPPMPPPAHSFAQRAQEGIDQNTKGLCGRGHEGSASQEQIIATSKGATSSATFKSAPSSSSAPAGNMDPLFMNAPKPSGYIATTEVDDSSAAAPTVMLIREMKLFPSAVNVQPMGPVGGARLSSTHFSMAD